MKTFNGGGTCLLIFLFFATSNILAQANDATCDKSCMRTMRDLIQMKKSGVGTTFLEKANSRLGDRVADGITKLFPRTKVYEPVNIQAYLWIIPKAFEAPRMIQIPRYRQPIATIRLLGKIRNRIINESLQREITDLIDTLRELEP